MALCVCIDCRGEFIAKRSDAKRCAACNRVIDLALCRKYNAEHAVELREYAKIYAVTYTRKPRVIHHEPKNCIYCGTEFIPNRTDALSCGKRDKQHRLNEKPKTLTIKCAQCGELFEKTTSDYNRTEARGGKHYCSRVCMGESYKNRVTLTCSECGKTFDRAISLVGENDKHHFCSKECQAKNTDYILRGEGHWHYIDGNTCYKRGANWLEQRRAARERDNFTCQHCGKTEAEIGKALDVHHMKPYRLFDDYSTANLLENLISLCPSCHHREDARLATI